MKCDDCDRDIHVGDWPFCPHPPARPHRPFKAYDIELDGVNYHIDSLHTAMNIERDSMQRYKDGRGQPYIFRAFHQDQSNYDRPTLPLNNQPNLQKSHKIQGGRGKHHEDR